MNRSQFNGLEQKVTKETKVGELNAGVPMLKLISSCRRFGMSAFNSAERFDLNLEWTLVNANTIGRAPVKWMRMLFRPIGPASAEAGYNGAVAECDRWDPEETLNV